MFGKSADTRDDGGTGADNPRAANPSQRVDVSVPWLETQAEVTGCLYEFAKLNTLSLGIAAGPNQFIISFSYYAHAQTFCNEFASPVAMQKGATFPIFYNPLNPQRNSRSETAPTSSVPLFAIGIAGSVVISLLYLGMVGGCQ